MTVRTDAISRWILMRYAAKSGRDETERFIASVQNLLTMCTPNEEIDNIETSTVHVIRDGRYEAIVKASTWVTDRGDDISMGVRSQVRMILTHADGWTLDPEGGLTLIVPETTRQRHMTMTREGKMNLSEVMQAEGLPDFPIKEMGSVGEHAIYIPKLRGDLSWSQSTYMAHGLAMRSAA